MIDLTLNGFMIGNMPSFNNAFGTKKTEPGKGCSTAENTINMMMPFLRQRPITVNSNTSTSVVEADAILNLSDDITTLTLGRGTYKGVELRIINDAESEVSLLSGAKIIQTNMGEILKLRWNGDEWRVKTSIRVGELVEQLPGQYSPIQKNLEGEYILWNDRAVLYGIGNAPPPASTDYYALRQSSPTIAANQRPIVCYHVKGSDWRLWQFNGEAAAYTIPEELDPVKWTPLNIDARVGRGECQRLTTKNPVTKIITVTDDLAIGNQITEGAYAGMYIWEVLVLGGKFLSVAGGFRPTFERDGVAGDVARRIYGSLRVPDGNFRALPSLGMIGTGAFIALNTVSGRGATLSNNSASDLDFDSSLVIKTGKQNSPESLSENYYLRFS